MCILENVNDEKFGEQKNEKATFNDFFFYIVIRLYKYKKNAVCVNVTTNCFLLCDQYP